MHLVLFLVQRYFHIHLHHLFQMRLVLFLVQKHFHIHLHHLFQMHLVLFPVQRHFHIHLHHLFQIRLVLYLELVHNHHHQISLLFHLLTYLQDSILILIQKHKKILYQNLFLYPYIYYLDLFLILPFHF